MKTLQYLHSFRYISAHISDHPYLPQCSMLPAGVWKQSFPFIPELCAALPPGKTALPEKAAPPG